MDRLWEEAKATRAAAKRTRDEPRPKIVFLDAATYGDISLQSFIKQWDCTIYQVTSPAETCQRLIGQSVAVTNKVVIDRAVFSSAAAKELELIAVAATGTDIIDREAAREFGVRVCNVPGYATQSVAQFTLALILELATRAARYGRPCAPMRGRRVPYSPCLTFRASNSTGKNSASSAMAILAGRSPTWHEDLGWKYLLLPVLAPGSQSLPTDFRCRNCSGKPT